MKTWKYDERDLRQDVETNLPDDWELRVFKVTSGDSGKEYWVQVLHPKLLDSEPKSKIPKPIVLCNCPEGTFLAPLTVLGLKQFWCKHSRNLIEFLGK